MSFVVSIFANVVFGPALLDVRRPVADPAADPVPQDTTSAVSVASALPPAS